MCVVVVVLDAPGLKGVDQRHESKRAHDVLQQLVLAEAAVPAVMADHKQLRRQSPAKLRPALLHVQHRFTLLFLACVSSRLR